jgi:plastocyanin
MTVRPGAIVSVSNNDSTTHTLTSKTVGRFDTGDIGAGRQASFTAPSAPGTYQFVCTIHPFMTGTLIVAS